jgi:uncharacterized protein with HEPN domain
MKHTLKTCLHDIIRSISEIEDFTRSCTTFEQFEHNILVKKAVERNITIVGEAVKRVLGFDAAAPISNARQIIAMRNIIIHDYENIETEVLYAAVVKHLPLLKQETTALLLASE